MMKITAIRTEAGYDVYEGERFVADVSTWSEVEAIAAGRPITTGCAAEWTMQP